MSERNDKEAILEKVRKLLALGGDKTNIHVAEEAMRKVAELMARHSIADAEVNPPSLTLGADLEVDREWVRYAAAAAGKLFTAVVCFDKTRPGKFNYVGAPADVAAASLLFKFLVKEVRNLSRAYEAALNASTTMLQDFRHGCAVGLYRRACMITAAIETEVDIDGISDSKSLVPVGYFAEKERKLHDMLNDLGVDKERKDVKLKEKSTAALHGARASSMIKMQEAVDTGKKSR